IHLDVEAAAARDVGERAVVVVAVEGGKRLSASRNQVLAIDEENVGPAVVIRVEEGAPGAQGLGEVLLAGTPGIVDEVDAGLRSDIGEGDGSAGSMERGGLTQRR